MSRRPQAGRSRRARCGGEHGSVSLLLVVAVFGLLIAVGLVVDGGQKLRSSQRADDAASEAARAAVLSIVPGNTVRGERPRVDQSAARRAAEAYLQRAGVSGSVTVGDGQVQVRTTSSFTPSFLSIIGLGAQTVTGQASARLVRGVEQEDRGFSNSEGSVSGNPSAGGR